MMNILIQNQNSTSHVTAIITGHILILVIHRTISVHEKIHSSELVIPWVASSALSNYRSGLSTDEITAIDTVRVFESSELRTIDVRYRHQNFRNERIGRTALSEQSHPQKVLTIHIWRTCPNETSYMVDSKRLFPSLADVLLTSLSTL